MNLCYLSSLVGLTLKAVCVDLQNPRLTGRDELDTAKYFAVQKTNRAIHLVFSWLRDSGNKMANIPPLLAPSNPVFYLDSKRHSHAHILLHVKTLKMFKTEDTSVYIYPGCSTYITDSCPRRIAHMVESAEGSNAATIFKITAAVLSTR